MEDTNLIDKLTTQEEMSGLLNLALNALKRLVKNGEFDYTDDIMMIAKDYTLNADTVAKFLDEMCELRGKDDAENRIICRDLYGAYVDFCEKIGRYCKHDNIFGSALVGKVSKGRRKVNGVQENCYLGIKLKKQQTQHTEDGQNEPSPNFF